MLRPNEVCNLHDAPTQMPNWTVYKNAMATIATLLHKELNSVISQSFRKDQVVTGAYLLTLMCSLNAGER